MTINSLQANTSTVVGGLGTQTYNVVTAGLYTCSFKSFIPYLASGMPPVTTQPSANVTDVTVAADTAGSRNNTYLTFYVAGNLRGYYVWFNINSAGTDPAVSGLTGIEVDGATGATASTLGGAARTAIAASSAGSYVTITGSGAHVIITQLNPGTLTAAANGAGGSSAGASFSVTSTGSFGDPAMSGLNIVINQNSTVVGRWGFPSPTQPIMGGSVLIQAAAADVITVVFSSLSTADAGLNAVKSIVNLFQGEGT
jgi:hypothetical protein